MTTVPAFIQKSAYSSPHSLTRRLCMLLWESTWGLFCSWTPKPLNPWRLLVLRAFGAKIHGHPFVHQNARVHFPANLIMHDRACLGDRAVAYTQGIIELRAGSTVAQEAYLCTGTHDFSDPTTPLVVAPIMVGEGAFIGARAFILPGVSIGRGAIVGAASVVTRNVPEGTVVAGNPARILPKQVRAIVEPEEGMNP